MKFKLLIMIVMMVPESIAEAISGTTHHHHVSDMESFQSTSDSVRVNGAYLALENTELDLGAFEPSESAEGIVRFRNEGDSALIIRRIITECGCTVASYPDTAVNPGSMGEIKVRFIGKGRVPGAFRKVLRIRSNAVNSKELIFVKGKILRSYVKR